MPSRATDARRAGSQGLPQIHTLQAGRQRLHVLPSLGGALAGWEWQRERQWLPLLRPWSADPAALYATACFPLLPWSNRITGGGFDFDGKHYPLVPNRLGEPYPIHGDSWRQAWTITAQAEDRMTLELESDRYDGNPYVYRARQLLTLRENALEIELRVTNTGTETLPYGLGLHPYFLRDAQTRLQFRSRGVWLSGPDRIPTSFTRQLPAGWDYNRPATLEDKLIDNCFEGWDGLAMIEDPTRGLRLQMHTTDRSGYVLMFRPVKQAFFCLEPVTHPIDAFHRPKRPGLIDLAPGEDMVLLTRFSVCEIAQEEPRVRPASASAAR
ncbi:aldose 1-epimerase [Herbaspirillum seropedicae]|uniref:Galactose-1-epimerase (Mutarotase) protein n=1 Tax=Herbaspirillum seropedicae (strain SmR1) TaxID=757424 RepID=D8J0Z4_HERSS|nr:aldose 1-epimerase [Herbaspirillum seropedicae]ADJ62549.1 galactose-1-epimerase (mutarotase) protein [Herbaspirillum seropedicae SmR1]AKN64663.1 galactose-1-epimerase [Herbaspirillum seropedicae]NQE30916.1 galactose-1-epimerase [Herbaspirillum seropedicae]UMU20602.1 aldose 1-epimerase [Herbaspirillum seropedicae]